MSQGNNYTDWLTIWASKYRGDQYQLENVCKDAGASALLCDSSNGNGVGLRYIQMHSGHSRDIATEIYTTSVSSYKISKIQNPLGCLREINMKDTTRSTEQIACTKVHVKRVAQKFGA